MDSERLLAAIVAALACNELMHIAFEIWGARQKVAWLSARMDRKPHGNWPININSLAKTIALHSVMFVVFTSVLYGIFTLANISTITLLYIGVIALVVTYSFTVFGMDMFHKEIGLLLKRYKKK